MHQLPSSVPSSTPRSKNENRWPIPPLASRPYDVTFIGKLEYEAKAEVSGVTLHRCAWVYWAGEGLNHWGG